MRALAMPVNPLPFSPNESEDRPTLAVEFAGI